MRGLYMKTVYLSLSVYETTNALSKIQFMINIKLLHVSAHSARNINCYEPVLETAQYHTVLISQHCNLMLVKFMYFRILIF